MLFGLRHTVATYADEMEDGCDEEKSRTVLLTLGANRTPAHESNYKDL